MEKIKCRILLKFDPSKSPRWGDFRFDFESTSAHYSPPLEGSGEVKMDFNANNKGNQTQPLILTDQGQYVWSEEPYAFELKGNAILISAVHGKILEVPLNRLPYFTLSK